MQSAAITIPEYLASLPAERRSVVSTVLDAVRRRMPEGYEETIAWGGITWQVPLSRYPDTYNGQALAYVGLAAQKHHYGLYLMCVYVDPEQEQRLRDGFARAGLKLDMGKSCLRFKRVEDLELDVVGDMIAATTPDEYIAAYERSRHRAKSGTEAASRSKASAGPAAAGRAAAKRASAKSPATPATVKRAGAKQPTAKRPAARSPAKRAR